MSQIPPETYIHISLLRFTASYNDPSIQSGLLSAIALELIKSTFSYCFILRNRTAASCAYCGSVIRECFSLPMRPSIAFFHSSSCTSKRSAKSVLSPSAHSGHLIAGIVHFLLTANSHHMVCGHVSYHLPACFFLLAVFRSHVSDLCNPPLHPRYFAWPIQFQMQILAQFFCHPSLV